MAKGPPAPRHQRHLPPNANRDFRPTERRQNDPAVRKQQAERNALTSDLMQNFRHGPSMTGRLVWRPEDEFSEGPPHNGGVLPSEPFLVGADYGNLEAMVLARMARAPVTSQVQNPPPPPPPSRPVPNLTMQVQGLEVPSGMSERLRQAVNQLAQNTSRALVRGELFSILYGGGPPRNRRPRENTIEIERDIAQRSFRVSAELSISQDTMRNTPALQGFTVERFDALDLPTKLRLLAAIMDQERSGAMAAHEARGVEEVLRPAPNPLAPMNREIDL